ncbi:MAG: hypothetical protein ACREIJ_11245 [Nitrospiraceae bacterium]
MNFLITPDEANLNQETDGPVLFDQTVPQDWNFQEYNRAENKPRILS